jgi:hypothetical protein
MKKMLIEKKEPRARWAREPKKKCAGCLGLMISKSGNLL